MWNHWVLRANHPHQPFRRFESAQWFWNRMMESFSDRVAAILMPNHLHLLLPKGRDEEYRSRLWGLAGAMSRREGLDQLWQPVPLPKDIPDRFHLKRHVRYVALNPCRKELCGDPLEWYWSTYREVMGCTPGSGDEAARLTRLLGEPLRDFRVRFHSYVSSDPSVAVAGTAPPQAAFAKDQANESLNQILSAAAAALRQQRSAVKMRGPLRTLFIHLAARHGWQKPGALAAICEITPRAVLYILSQSGPDGLGAADICLGDDRLRREELFPK